MKKRLRFILSVCLSLAIVCLSSKNANGADVATAPRVVSSTYGSYEGNHNAFHNALRGLGLNFLYFTDRQMRLGEVDLSKFKVIILPLTQAMSSRWSPASWTTSLESSGRAVPEQSLAMV